ncbi:protein-L-isoaspartate(D-aspartate) O-methyltransferase [Alteromonas ponticola]|uniref:Protein-L-isoaspartate O-methyltransferase n=1 Tax=Alteromonas ponticola TaxID=2720613 RepID=A0ABX1QYD9_9ALTE|nr:protein-L-isoaspartate(D-aspartate) O-methyltransferase [Alteromonas ponticola]NMH59234.1 protein-L-isoaspartate(D-aspartate) O-methyltransferase [Alteromonas ponticola]
MAHSGIDTAAEKRRMLTRHLAGRDIRDSRVLQAMQTVPREAFVGALYFADAYIDAPLPIDEGQTISQPYIVAKMVELAEIDHHARVLEVGAGSGYGAAILGQIAAQVFSIERIAHLATNARQVIQKLGYTNITIVHGDGTQGLMEHAPFDAIIVTAATSFVPDALKEQLVFGGSIIVPVGDDDFQQLIKLTRMDVDSFERTTHGAVRFVPLLRECEG